MPSLRAVLSDETVYNFSLLEIVNKYREWVLDDLYMIINRQELKAFHIRDNEKPSILAD